MIELPAGWMLCEIGDVLRPVEKTGKHDEDRVIWYVDISSIDSKSNRILAPKRMTLAEAPSRARQKIRSGDVLFSTVRPYLRKIATVDRAFDGEIASTGFAVLRAARGVEPRYLFYKCISHDFVSALTGEQYGVSYPAVKEEQVRAQLLELPPTDEQRRIVDKIEELFTEIDRGVETLRAAKKTLVLYRQSLLKSAFEGRLTADWRARNPDKLESPDALFARIREERERRYKNALDDWERAAAEWRRSGETGKRPARPKRPLAIPAETTDDGFLGWTTVPLGLAIVDPTYGTSKKCDYGLGVTGVLRIPNIGSGRIDPTELKSANFDKVEAEKYSLEEGDVLTIRSNGSPSMVGKPAIVEQRDTNYLFAGYLIRLRPIPILLHSRYLVFLMLEPNVRAQIEAKAKSTSGVNNISARELQALSVPICSFAEQTEIVRLLEVQMEAAEMLDTEIDTTLTRADALRQSILKKAFSGQLVPRDPTDEPASALLERIKAECSRAPKVKKRRTDRA